MVDIKYVYGIAYGHTDRELVENVEKAINDLLDIYLTVEVVSVSHSVRDVGFEEWSAFITCEVTSHNPTYQGEIHT